MVSFFYVSKDLRFFVLIFCLDFYFFFSFHGLDVSLHSFHTQKGVHFDIFSVYVHFMALKGVEVLPHFFAHKF